MIRIFSNKPSYLIYNDIIEIYSIYSNNVKPYCNIPASSQPCDSLTPYIHDLYHFVNSKYLSEFKESIYYIGESYKLVTDNNNLVDTRLWEISDDEILYDISEFTINSNENINRKLKSKDIIMNIFNKYNFRYMCIKAEILIYIYYVMLSKFENENIDNENTDDSCFRLLTDGINYATIKQKSLYEHIKNKSKHFRNVNSRAKYIFELNFLMKVINSTNKNTFEQYMKKYVVNDDVKVYNINAFHLLNNVENQNIDFALSPDIESIINQTAISYTRIMESLPSLLSLPVDDETMLPKICNLLMDIIMVEIPYRTTQPIIEVSQNFESTNEPEINESINEQTQYKSTHSFNPKVNHPPKRTLNTSRFRNERH